jgi:benzoyl-CoA reductase/2-hydroxyglutaryl-CoA dehydratase subunit BcrC/BadD/HgdB
MVSKKDVVAPVFMMRYVNTVEEKDLKKALTNNTRRFIKLLKQMPGKKIDYAYAEGKWTVREMLQHVIDAEKVFTYRALTFARKDASPLPGFDENTWAVTAKASKRKWNDLVNEFKAMRAANELFFTSLDDDQLIQTGTANNNVMNVAGLGFVCAGHVAHHIHIIKERYLTDAGIISAGSEKARTKKDKSKKKK